MKRKPSHATVVAYLALFVALATGGAYAVERITSKQVQNNSLRSADLKDRKGVGGVDVKRDALAGKEVDEAALNASEFAPVAGVNGARDCNPASSTPIDCVSTRVNLRRQARLLVVATGGRYAAASDPDGSAAGCDIRIDGSAAASFATPGGIQPDSDSGATDGFARTLVTPDPLPAGEHEVALACWELEPDVRIETPTIAVIAISAG